MKPQRIIHSIPRIEKLEARELLSAVTLDVRHRTARLVNPMGAVVRMQFTGPGTVSADVADAATDGPDVTRVTIDGSSSKTRVMMWGSAPQGRRSQPAPISVGSVTGSGTLGALTLAGVSVTGSGIDIEGDVGAVSVSSLSGGAPLQVNGVLRRLSIGSLAAGSLLTAKAFPRTVSIGGSRQDPLADPSVFQGAAPSITVNHIPTYGSSERLTGTVFDVHPSDYEICCFLHVNGGFWNKPTFAAPLTVLDANGSFSINVDTGGVDQFADKYVLILVKVGTTVPLLSGAAEIPADLTQNGAAELEVPRPSNPVSSSGPIHGAGTPSIQFTSVPAMGSSDLLRGVVDHVDPSQYSVVVYLKVGSWWGPKPYWSFPDTAISPNGTWSTQVVSGGDDENASDIIALVLPKSYTAPSLAGASSLPDELAQNAIAQVSVHRTE